MSTGGHHVNRVMHSSPIFGEHCSSSCAANHIYRQTIAQKSEFNTAAVQKKLLLRLEGTWKKYYMGDQVRGA